MTSLAGDDIVDFALTTSPGLEEVLAAEAEELGLSALELGPGAVTGEGPRSLLPRLNLELSTALRVLCPVAEGPCRHADDLAALAEAVPWEEVLDVDGFLAVSVSGRGPESIRHTRFAAQRVKDGVCDRFRERFGRRPSVDFEQPDLSIHLHLNGDHASLSLDSSGDSLHRRGYRTDGGGAALRETLAAGLIRSTRWDRASPFIDLMCGAGTLAIEAARLARGLPPGAEREFAFRHWRPGAWPGAAELEAARAARLEALTPKDAMPLIIGYDADPHSVARARENAARAGVHDFVRFEQRRLDETAELPDPGEAGVLIANPPYGERLGEVSELKGLYRSLGDVFKQRGAGYHGYVLTGSRALSKAIGLRSRRKQHLSNGAIPCRFLHFELYEGTRKPGRVGNPRGRRQEEAEGA